MSGKQISVEGKGDYCNFGILQKIILLLPTKEQSIMQEHSINMDSDTLTQQSG